jgi:hypothetical protein
MPAARASAPLEKDLFDRRRRLATCVTLSLTTCIYVNTGWSIRQHAVEIRQREWCSASSRSSRSSSLHRLGDRVTLWAPLSARERRAEASLLLDHLTRRKRRLIIERFGLDGRKEGDATIEELAEEEGVSGSRMSQILTVALRKLAHGQPLRRGRASLLAAHRPACEPPTRLSRGR